jgi:hypothetical protein
VESFEKHPAGGAFAAKAIRKTCSSVGSCVKSTGRLSISNAFTASQENQTSVASLARFFYKLQVTFCLGALAAIRATLS